MPEDMTYRLLNIAIKLKKEKGDFRISDIQEHLNFSNKIIRKRLSTLVARKIFENNNGKYKLRLDL